MDVHPITRSLIDSLDPTQEYAITRDLVAHKITRRGHTVPDSPIVFYDNETSREIGLAFGGSSNYIRLNTDDIRHLQGALRLGHALRHDTQETIESLNAVAQSV